MKFTAKLIVFVVVIALLVIGCLAIGAWYVNTRNKFVTLDEDVQQQWSKVEVQYQRRLDLIPNLVQTVKGYAEHESSTFESVTRVRAGLEDAYNAANSMPTVNADTNEQSFNQYTNAQQALGRALSIYVNAVHEAYPDLKADKQFLDLQTQLEGTENRIATERGRYTETVKTFNVAVRTFPSSIVASMAGFTVKPQYEADAEASVAPKVSFD